MIDNQRKRKKERATKFNKSKNVPRSQRNLFLPCMFTAPLKEDELVTWPLSLFEITSSRTRDMA